MSALKSVPFRFATASFNPTPYQRKMGESSPPLVAPRKGEVGSALPKMGSMIPPTGGTTTTTTTTARTLDDLADLRDLDEDALLQALQDDPELAEMVYREFEGELRREREEEEEGGGDGGGGGGGGRGSAATEEERAARRERIRARQVARERGGEPVAGAEAVKERSVYLYLAHVPCMNTDVSLVRVLAPSMPPTPKVFLILFISISSAPNTRASSRISRAWARPTSPTKASTSG